MKYLSASLTGRRNITAECFIIFLNASFPISFSTILKTCYPLQPYKNTAPMKLDPFVSNLIHLLSHGIVFLFFPNFIDIALNRLRITNTSRGRFRWHRSVHTFIQKCIRPGIWDTLRAHRTLDERRQ